MKQIVYILWYRAKNSHEEQIDRIYVQESKARGRVNIMTRPNLDNDPELEFYITEEEVIL